MAGYFKGGFGKLKTGLSGRVRLRSSMGAPAVEPPVAGGFFVSPTGSDAANGSSATPFASISRALTATRAGSEKKIFLRGGTHILTGKISLSSADKGTSFSAYPGEIPVISGGERLTGFADEGDGVYSKLMGQPTGLDLFIGGVRQRAAQRGEFSPANPYRSGWLPAEGLATPSATKFRYKSGALPDGVFQAGLVVQVFDASRQFDFISNVSAIDSTAREITLTDPHFSGPIQTGATFRLLNNAAFIGRDGEFAWRNMDSKLVVRPSSATFESQGVVIPFLEGLIDLQNGADDIVFLGVTFSDSRNSGYAISVTNSHRVRIGSCVFRNSGDGIQATGGTDGWVGGCVFSDLANNGVVLNAGCAGWKIYANRFSHLGKIRKGAAALFGQGGDSITFGFNEVQYAPRFGATFRGGGSHRMLYNIIKDTGNETADSAAIEFLGKAATDLSSLVEGNWIDRITGYPANITGEFSTEFNDTEFLISTESPRSRSAAIHLNDLASDVTVRGNFTRGASVGHFVVDGGDRNIFENNLSILDEFDDLYASVRANTTVSDPDLVPDSNSFRKNVIYSIPLRTVNPWSLTGLGTGTAINENLYHNANGAVGFDTLSTGGNPNFIGMASDDFRFASNSPALAMGIPQLGFDRMGVKGYTQTSSVTYGLENFWGAVLAPGTVEPGTGFTLQTSKVENYDTQASWEGQETTVGLMFAKGDVVPGQVVVAVVDGKDVTCQLDHRIHWPDGSLRTATASWLMPSIPAGQTKDVVWTRRNGTWNNAPMHTATTAITGKVNLEYAFTSWKGRSTTNVLTEERGPKYFRSSDMLATSNSAWIEQTMAGPVMTEWRTSMFAKKGDNTTDPNFACLLYVRAWGGTNNNPSRIQFVYRTMHSWSDNSVPADENGVRVDMDLKVGSTIIRGKTTATAGWSARDGFKSGFFASCGADAKMDWVSSTGQVLSPPKLIVRHDFAYGVKTKFFPPYDVNNPNYWSNPPSIDYVPAGRGSLSFQQDDVGDNGNIPWHVSTNFARSMIAHARRPAAEVALQDRIQRVTAWGLGALGNIGYDKTTRKLVCYLPPERNPNPTALGPSVYNGTKPTIVHGDYNPYVKGRDAAHFPQVTFWTALTEGDTHMRDLCMAEATIPPTFEANAYGFFGNIEGLPFGSTSILGQTRAVGQTTRAMLTATVLADPQDPNGQLAKALLYMQLDASALVPQTQDAWRGGSTLRDNKMLHPPSGNEPAYKMWMHLFAAKALTYGAAVLDDPKVAERAHWWMHLPIVMSGGYQNDSDYLMKPDPFHVSNYNHICMSGPGPSAQARDRQAWKPGQWTSTPRACDYSTDGQTVTFIGGGPCVNGMIMTVTGVHNLAAEPSEVTDFSKQPAGLTRWDPYYAVQSNGSSCKLALTPGGAPVTFNTGGVVIRGMIARAHVRGVTPGTAVGTVTGTGPGSYFVQHQVALDLYRHYLAPNDSRVQLARNTLKVYKDADTVQPGYDIRGKTTVPF